MAETAKKEISITFYEKTETKCPICGYAFHRETLRTGGGRLNSDRLSDELRRFYKPTEKYGEIHPLIYYVMVCPHCYFAAFEKDFSEIKNKERPELKDSEADRKAAVSLIFPDVNFESERTLKEGIASYYLACASYKFRVPDLGPTIKQGISCLRAAWLLSDLHKKEPGHNYDLLAKCFYQNAARLYRRAVHLESTGKEAFSSVAGLGPDIDKNYGFDGVLYLAGLLEYRYGSRADMRKRITVLEEQRRSVSRVFGMGRSDKNKPKEVLDKARDLYNELGEYISEQTEELSDSDETV